MKCTFRITKNKNRKSESYDRLAREPNERARSSRELAVSLLPLCSTDNNACDSLPSGKLGLRSVNIGQLITKILTY